MKKLLADKGIKAEMTAPYSPSQNGVSEHINRTIVEKTRALLIGKSIPFFLWPEAVTYAVYLRNRSPTKHLPTPITPYEAFWGYKPDVSQLQEFGTNCWVLTQGQNLDKLKPKSKPYRFIGLSEETRAWYYWVPKTRKVLTSRNVIFKGSEDNDDEYIIGDLDTLQLEGEPEKDSEFAKVSPEPENSNPADGSHQTVSPAQVPVPPTPPAPTEQLNKPDTAPASPTEATASPPTPAPPKSKKIPAWQRPEAPTHVNPPRNVTSLYKPLNNPSNLSPSHPDAWRHVKETHEEPDDTVNVIIEREPRTYHDVLEHPHSKEWLKSMQEEIDQLNNLKTFEVVDLPAGRKPIDCKWVYIIKTDATGAIVCQKS
jgi:hypothetical protein